MDFVMVDSVVMLPAQSGNNTQICQDIETFADNDAEAETFILQALVEEGVDLMPNLVSITINRKLTITIIGEY